MKITTLNGSFIRGHGVDTVISSTLKIIHENYHDVELELLCNETQGLLEDGFPEQIPITVAGRPEAFGYHHFVYFCLAQQISDDDNSIIHMHHPMAIWPFLFKGGKKIITWHGNNNLNWDDEGFGSWSKRIARKSLLDASTHMLRSLDRIVTISDYLRNELIDRYHISGSKIDRVYWGIDSNKFTDTGEDEEYMFFVGRHVNYKNIKMLIDLSKQTNFPLVCAGDGYEKNDLENYARKLGAPVEFKGKVPLNKLVELYQKCSFYVTASKWEGFGLPPLEANACGKPVLVPNNTAHIELTKDSKTGYICSDFEDFCQHARKLIDEPNVRQDMGKAAREYVVTNFKLDSAAAAYMDIYRKLNR